MRQRPGLAENDVLATYQRTSFSGRRDASAALKNHELAQPAIHRSCLEFTGFPLLGQPAAHRCNQPQARLLCLLKAKLRATVLEVAALGLSTFQRRSPPGFVQ